MLIGPVCGSVAARVASHSWSPHSYEDCSTTEAVAGGASVARAIGSAFCRQTPSRPRISYLYLVPAPGPGTNSSHTPVDPSARIGKPRPSQ